MKKINKFIVASLISCVCLANLTSCVVVPGSNASQSQSINPSSSDNSSEESLDNSSLASSSNEESSSIEESSSSLEASSSLVQSSEESSEEVSSSSSEAPISSESSSQVTSSSSSSEKESSSSSAIISSSSEQIASSSSSSEEAKPVDFNYTGENNQIVLKFIDTTSADSFNVYYKENSSSDLIKLESDLIRADKAVILGLKAGNYQVKLVPVYGGKEDESKGIQKSDIVVSDLDRSGYAGFKSTDGVGAYNKDGTLKSKALVVYVNDSNKNTVTLTVGSKSYKGLGNILKYQYKFGCPLDIRLQGTIKTNQFKSKSFTPLTSGQDADSYKDRFINELETTYTNLDGLVNKVWGCSDPNTSDSISYQDIGTSYKDTDSYFNMMDVSSGKDITVEGLFDDASIFQWGFTFKTSSSIEVRNITFTDYPEDACSFEGGSSSYLDNKNFFFHNNVVNIGKNNWDLSQEQDKHEGDGSMDLKRCGQVTCSYNRFNNCHKTGLVGGGDDHITYSVTYHHNYYNKCSSRLPLGRQANMHMYNNYYYGCGKCLDLRANAYALSENNYFSKCEFPGILTINADKDYHPNIKSLNDIYTSCANKTPGVIVTDRLATVSNKCNPIGTDYSKFDTNSSYFYFDEVAKKSDVSIMLQAKDVPTYLESRAGLNQK